MVVYLHGKHYTGTGRVFLHGKHYTGTERVFLHGNRNKNNITTLLWDGNKNMTSKAGSRRDRYRNESH
jgi:hypothetical protein